MRISPLILLTTLFMAWCASASTHAADATLPAVISGVTTYGPANTTGTNSTGTQITATGAATVKSGKFIINPGTNGFKVALGGALHCQLVPFFPSAPIVSPSPIVGTTGTVSVTAAQWYLGAATATYSWSKVSGPGSVSFSPNATNAAKTATATFTAGGAYVVQVTATGADDSANSYPLSVTVVLGSAVPTVATTASASPNPVTGKTTLLNVLGADDGGEAALTYTWATTGAPPAAVTFSANGTNAAKSSTATFTKAGTYSLQCTIKDAGNLTITSTVVVTVQQTATSVAVTPTSANVVITKTQPYTAVVKDQFGAALSTQPAITWSPASMASGTLSSTGLFTANTTVGGPYTLTATGAGKSGTATVTVVNAAPTVATAAAATPNPTTGTTVLSVLGADDGGEAALTYNWATVGTPPASVTFSTNGTNAAKSSTATLTKAGTYTLQCTIKDAGNLTVTSTVTVTMLEPRFQEIRANANPTTVTGTTTTLFVTGANVADPAVTYTWKTVGFVPGPVSYSVNGTNAAKQTVATFTKPGKYIFCVNGSTLPQWNTNGREYVVVNVQQKASSLALSPSTAVVAVGGTQTFTPIFRDQFAGVMLDVKNTGALQWRASGGGTMSTGGVFTSNSAGGPFTVTCSDGTNAGSASVTTKDINDITQVWLERLVDETNEPSIPDPVSPLQGAVVMFRLHVQHPISVGFPFLRAPSVQLALSGTAKGRVLDGSGASADDDYLAFTREYQADGTLRVSPLGTFFFQHVDRTDDHYTKDIYIAVNRGYLGAAGVEGSETITLSIAPWGEVDLSSDN
jgi:plastocyanin